MFLQGSRPISSIHWRIPVLTGALLWVFSGAAWAGGIDRGLQGVRIEQGESPEAFCADEACRLLRWVRVSRDDLDAWLGYDAGEVSRPLSTRALHGEREVSLAVRLLVSEVGADRLLENRNAIEEAVGILYTVDNRRVREIWNPLDARVTPFKGCGEGASFASCANGAQYNGMATWRAQAPRSGYDEVLLDRAMDVAVTAWVLQETGILDDFTGGATNFVHRCGGSAYGKSTYHCDGTVVRGVIDQPGARSHSGPTLFRAPHTVSSEGYYRMRQVALVDYVRQPRTTLDEVITPWESTTAWLD